MLLSSSGGRSFCVPGESIRFSQGCDAFCDQNDKFASGRSRKLLAIDLACVEVPWTWEKESRGQKPKSLQKVSKKSPGASRPRGPKSPKKSRKRSEKSPKSLRMGFLETFQTFFETFFGLLGTRGRETPGDFFETFWRLFGFWPRDSFSQVHGTSTLVIQRIASDCSCDAATQSRLATPVVCQRLPKPRRTKKGSIH